MGNQQSKKHQAQVQPIKEVEVELKHVTPKQDSFVQEIQNENERNVNQRKSTVQVIDQNTPATTANNPAPRLSKKQLSKKELPPLKLKNATSMKSTPLGNCQNITNQANNGVQQLEEVQCQKGQKTTGNNANDQVLGEMDDKESEGQKENNEAAMNMRAKKFRPSQASSGKKTIIASSAFVNEARQASQLDEVTAV